jgi:hypothetical protein
MKKPRTQNSSRTKTNERKRLDYDRYAEACLEIARLAPTRKARTIQREMAAEWLRLAAKSDHEPNSN